MEKPQQTQRLPGRLVQLSKFREKTAQALTQLQLGARSEPEGVAQSVADSVWSGFQQLGAVGVQHRDLDLLEELGRFCCIPCQQRRQASRTVGAFEGAALTVAHLLGAQESPRQQGSDVSQHGSRSKIKAVGQLLVGQCNLAAQANDPQSSGVPESPHLRGGRWSDRLLAEASFQGTHCTNANRYAFLSPDLEGGTVTRTAFANGWVFDGTGADPAVADVVVQDDRIVDVGVGLDGDIMIDCSGQALLPGLFDCHVHLTISRLDALEWASAPFSLQFYEAARNMEQTLASGVTSVRDAGGADLGIAVAQRRGLIRGPRVQVSIHMISQTGGHGDPWEASGRSSPIFIPHPGRPSGVADGVEALRAKVREMVRAGADIIKIATTGGVFSPRDDPRHGHYRDAEIAAIVEEADAAGLAVMAHAQGNAGIKAAVRCGVRSIEHGFFLDDETIEMMLERGTWLVPTLAATEGVRQAIDDGTALRPGVAEKELLVAHAAEASVRAAIAAGVKIAMGTDAPVYPHGRNLRELELLVEHGMSPTRALHAATGSAAALMGVDRELGTLEPGKRADLVLADGHPLDLAGLDRRIRAVYQDGVRVVRVSDEQVDGDEQ